MSAVIWFGIVAVWAFVLIPTWVRRSDLHWRSSGETAGARDRLGRAARVISRSGSRVSSIPRARHSADAVSDRAPSRKPVPAATVAAAVSRDSATATVDPAAPSPAVPAPTAPAAPAAEPEDPMTTARSPRPAPRRTSASRSAAGGATPLPPQVVRARRLVWL